MTTHGIATGDVVIVVIDGCACRDAIVYIANAAVGLPRCDRCGEPAAGRFRADVVRIDTRDIAIATDELAGFAAAVERLAAHARPVSLGYFVRGHEVSKLPGYVERWPLSPPAPAPMPGRRVAAAAVAWPAQLRRFRGNA